MIDKVFEAVRNDWRHIAKEIDPSRYNIVIELEGQEFEISVHEYSFSEEVYITIDSKLGDIRTKSRSFVVTPYDKPIIDLFLREVNRAIKYLIENKE